MNTLETWVLIRSSDFPIRVFTEESIEKGLKRVRRFAASVGLLREQVLP
jgi:hypothetical protein